MLTKLAEKPENLSYVLLELVNKKKLTSKNIKAVKDIECGLFEGIMVHMFDDNTTRVYIVLRTAKNET
ncbi:MAG: hypothetical protein U9R24_05755, partial [Thermodesulfobacteriota bacterium]|nr:hypothetical protein [Thermodesulfobacteriota bacterium]